MKTLQERRVELAMTMTNDPQHVRRLVRSSLIDVALDGRRAVHRHAAAAVRGKVGKAYGAAANDSSARKTA